MALYVHPEVRELEAEVKYTPPRMRRPLVQRLESLLPEIQADRLYTYEYIFERVTLFKPDAAGDVLLTGTNLFHDLGMLLRRISPEVPLLACQLDEPVMTLEEIAAAERVSPATVRKWGLTGLTFCAWILADGSRGWGSRKSSYDKFAAQRRAQELARNRRMTAAERQDLREKLRQMPVGGSRAAMLRQIAAECHCSMGTLRRLLGSAKIADAPDAPRHHRCDMTPSEREEMVRLHRQGATLAELATRFRRTRTATCRLLRHALVDWISSLDISYIPSPEFAGSEAEALCMGASLMEFPAEELAHPPAAPDDMPPYLQELYRIALLSADDERRLFRKYNYIKYCLAIMQEKVRDDGYRRDRVERFMELHRAAEHAQRILIRANLRLVVSIAKQHVGPLATLLDLVSEGNVCLMRAVECFNYGRNVRFSTYATWAISKHFARMVPEENYHFTTFVTGRHEQIAGAGDRRPDPAERTEGIAHLRQVLGAAVGHLSARERAVIEGHYGTDGHPARTLEQIGQGLGLTRERIRQIEADALAKLRLLVTPEMV